MMRPRKQSKSMNWRHHIPRTYPAVLAAGACETWPCPMCEGEDQASCELCQGAGRFDAAVLLKLRSIRRENGMTLQEVAGVLGVSKDLVCRLERGQSLAPRPRQRHRREPAKLLIRYIQLCRRT